MTTHELLLKILQQSDRQIAQIARLRVSAKCTRLKAEQVCRIAQSLKDEYEVSRQLRTKISERKRG